jgi:tetratricopeptide (TPR) repeat protein
MNLRLQSWLRYQLAQWLSVVKLHRRAAELLEQTVQVDPQYGAAWRYLGFLHAQQGRDDAAIRAFGEALRIDSGDHVTRFNLGFLLHQHRRWRDAIEEFEKVVQASPTNDRAWYGLGLCREQIGEMDAAVAALKEAARLQYFNPHAGYQLALVYHRLGRRDEARAEYERVKSFDPKFADQIRRETGIV